MKTFLVDLDTLFKIMFNGLNPLEKPSIFCHEKKSAYHLYGYKGPILLKTVIRKKDIIEWYAEKNNVEPAEDKIGMALTDFQDKILSNTIRISGTE
jgi:hypothetical protein